MSHLKFNTKIRILQFLLRPVCNKYSYKKLFIFPFHVLASGTHKEYIDLFGHYLLCIKRCLPSDFLHLMSLKSGTSILPLYCWTADSSFWTDRQSHDQALEDRVSFLRVVEATSITSQAGKEAKLFCVQRSAGTVTIIFH